MELPFSILYSTANQSKLYGLGVHPKDSSLIFYFEMERAEISFNIMRLKVYKDPILMKQLPMEIIDWIYYLDKVNNSICFSTPESTYVLKHVTVAGNDVTIESIREDLKNSPEGKLLTDHESSIQYYENL